MDKGTVRELPRMKYGKREYFIDGRLQQFRSASYPPHAIEFVPFDSEKGGWMWARLLSGKTLCFVRTLHTNSAGSAGPSASGPGPLTGAPLTTAEAVSLFSGEPPAERLGRSERP
jgi:hypothetical protein